MNALVSRILAARSLGDDERGWIAPIVASLAVYVIALLPFLF